MKIVTATQMQALDRRTITEARVPGLTLMERAGSGTANFLRNRFGPLTGKRVTIVCGKGNNGGDGLVIARLLRQHRARVTVLLLTPAAELSRDAKAMYRRWLRVGGTSATKSFRSPEQAEALLADSELIVDALLGTGLSTPVTGAYREAIRLMNEAGRPGCLRRYAVGHPCRRWSAAGVRCPSLGDGDVRPAQTWALCGCRR